MRWTRTLAGLSDDRRLVRTAASHRAVLLTGQSSWRHSLLSPSQHELLAAVEAAGYVVVEGGFPFHADLVATPWPGPAPLARASVRNARQFLAARLDPAFRTQLVRHLQPLLDLTTERLLVVTGSSGLHLWAQTRPALRVPAGLEVTIVALGPVMTPAPLPGGPLPGGLLPGGPLDPTSTLTVIQGRRDLLSRIGFQGTVDHVVDAGHLDYSEVPEVRDLVGRLAVQARTAGRP